VSAPVLTFADVSKTFTGRRSSVRAVDSLSLQVGRGEVVGLVGESGAGKTTAGRLALGLVRPDAGTVTFDGVRLGELPAAEVRRTRQRMHFIHQDPYQSFHPAMRVHEAVAEPLAIAGVARRARRDRVARALEEVQLAPAGEFLDRYPHELSGGQRQRAAFARALVAEPKLVVADEPVSMLDVSLQAGILDLVDSLRAGHGMAFLFVTHDLAVARHVTDRIAVMYEGRIVELGGAEDLVRQPLHPYTVALLRAVDELAPPPEPRGPFPPGGQPCQRHGRCDPDDAACRDATPRLLEQAPGHLCATHVEERTRP
jgi:oligopeptide/dipeptide ABC transporter ATP-binding protein